MSYRRIEFIGGPAIGKSALLKEVLKARPSSDTWKTPGETLTQIARGQSAALFPPNVRALMILALRTGAFQTMQPALTSRIMDAFEEPAFLSSWPTSNGLLELLFAWLAGASHLEPYHKAKVAAFYLSVVKKHAMLAHFGAPGLVVDDDGIVHNNPKLADRDAYRALLRRDPRIGAGIRPAGVVYCRLSLDAFCERRQKRIDRKAGIFLDRPLSRSEFLAECRRLLDLSARKVEWMREDGAAILEVDMARNPAENSPAVLRFIRDTGLPEQAPGG